MIHSTRFVNKIQRLRRWVDRLLAPSDASAPCAGPCGIRRPASSPEGSSSPAIEPLESRTLLTTTILFEGFEEPFPSTNGWSVADTNPTGTPAHWGAVDAGFGGQGVHGGFKKGYVAGIGYSGDAADPSYPLSMTSTMSRTIDLTGLSAATLEFWHKIPDDTFGTASIYIDSTKVWDYEFSLSRWNRQAISLDLFLGGVRTLTFEHLGGTSPSQEGWYLDDIRVTDQPFDPDPDPDDTIGEAHHLGAVSPGGSISFIGQSLDLLDVDMVSFTAMDGQTLGFDIDQMFPDQSSNQLRLFDAAGILMDWSGEGAGPDPETLYDDAYLEHTFAVGGVFYLGISSYYNSTYNPITGNGDSPNIETGGYDLFITDRMDPDDTMGESIDLGAIGIGGSSERIEESIGFRDVDMFSFTVDAGQTLGFDLDIPLQSMLISHLRLFDSSGAQLTNAYQDAELPGEYWDDDDFMVYTFESHGTYYLGISNFDNITYDPITGMEDGSGYYFYIGDYNLRVLDLSDSDDTIGEAFDLGPIPIGGSLFLTGQSISIGTDVDMVSFTAAAGQTLGFDLDRAVDDASLFSVLRLFDASGVQIATGQYGLGPSPERYGEPYLEFTFTTGGVHYLALSTNDNNVYNPITGYGDISSTSRGGYDLIVTDRLDPDDTIAEAFNLGPVASGGAAARTGQMIDISTDVDMIAFTAFAGQKLGFDIDRPASGGLDGFLRLFDASGATLATNHTTLGPIPESTEADPYLEFVFTEAGTYYLGISANLNLSYDPITGEGDQSEQVSAGDYDLFITDRVDPDDTFASAFNLGVIEMGGSASRAAQSIDFRDVDMFAFTVVAGQKIGFDIDRVGGDGLNSHLRLFDESGMLLAANQDGVGPMPEQYDGDSYLEFTFATGGTYYLGVSASGNQTYSPTAGTGDSSTATVGGYDLVVSHRVDPDDTILEAIGLGVIVIGGSAFILDQAIDPGDVDLYSFTVMAGQTLGFDIDRTDGSRLNSYLSLFNAAGSRMTLHNAAAGPIPETGFGFDSYLKYTFLNSGTYYLGVSSTGNINYNPITGTGDAPGSAPGGYSLFVTDRPADPDDTIAEAFNLGPIVSGGSVTYADQLIEDGTDVDMVSITVSEGQTLGFDIEGAAGGGLNSRLRLFNASGSQLAFNDDGSGPSQHDHYGDSYLEYSFTTGGTYHLGISAKENSSYNSITGALDSAGLSAGSYSLVIMDRIDPDDTFAEAFDIGAVQVGRAASLTGQAIDFRDVDMIAFTVTAGRTLGFDVDRAVGSALDSHLRLFDSTGATLVMSDNTRGPAPEPSDLDTYPYSNLDSYLEYTFTTAGTYYLGVSARSNIAFDPITGHGDSSGSTTGGYDLLILDLKLDLNHDFILSAPDIDLLYKMLPGDFFDPGYDLDHDGTLAQPDLDTLIRDILETEFGDADLDGQVSLGDLVILAENFNQPGGWAKGDFNGDGLLTLGDLVILAENFGAGEAVPLTADEADAQLQPLAGLQALGLTDGVTTPDQDPAADMHAPFADILAELGAELRNGPRLVGDA